MGTLIAYADGNLTGASTFKAAEVGSGALQMIRSGNGSVGQNASQTSDTFTVTNGKVIEGVLLWVQAPATAVGGTFKVDLQKGGVSQASVTVNCADLPPAINNGAVVIAIPTFFKFTSTATGDGNATWTLVLTCNNVTGAACLYSKYDSTASHITRALRTSTTATPAAADDLYICGELTGAGTYNFRTVAMDSTAATAYGNGTVNDTTHNGGGVRVSMYGALTYGTASTWDSTDKDAAITLSNGNLTATGGASGDKGVRSATGHASGKYYLEFTAGATYSGGDTGVGISRSGQAFSGIGASGANAAVAFASGGSMYFNGASTGNNIGATAPADVVCVAIDFDAKKMWFRKNAGSWIGSSNINTGDPAAGTFGLDITALFGGGTLPGYPVFISGNGSSSITTVNLGASAFAQTPPVGYRSWGPGPAASTNYVLRVNGDVEVYQSGKLDIGSVGAEVPRTSTAVLELQQVSASGDFGLSIHHNAIWNSAGLSRTSGKNIVKAKLTSDVTGASGLSTQLGSATNGSYTNSGSLDAAGTSLFASSFTDNVTNATHGVFWTSGGIVNNTTQVAQAWLARGSGTNNRFVRMAFGNANVFSSIVNGVYVDIDLQAGTVGTATAIGNGTATSASITPVGGGYLVTLIGKATSGSNNPSVLINACSAAGTTSFAGAGNQCFIFEGVQLVTAASLGNTTFNVDTDTGWKSGDIVVVGSTTRTSGDSENFVLNADAGASSFTSALYPFGSGGQQTSSASTHSGTSPTQAEVGLLTRNVKIRSTSSSLAAYVFIRSLAVVTVSWTQFYYLGKDTFTSKKRGIEIWDSGNESSGGTSGAKSFSYCSNHDNLGGQGFLMACGGSTTYSLNLSITYTIIFNTSNSTLMINSITGSDWTIDNCIAMRSGNYGYYLGDMSGTFTNNIASSNTGASAGIYFGAGGTSNIVGTCDGNVAHSNQAYGFNSSSVASGVVSNLSVWRNNLYGITSGANCQLELVFTNLTCFGNHGTYNINWGTCDVLNILGGTIAGDTSFSVVHAIALSQNSLMTLNIQNVDFSGTGTGLAPHTTDELISISGNYPVQGRFLNCKFGAPFMIASAAGGKSGWTKSSYLTYQNYGQVAGDHRTEMKYGTLKADTAIYNGASPSWRMTPNTASIKLESAPKFSGFLVPVSSGNAAAVSATVRKSQAGSSTTTWNGSDKSANITLSGGNLTAACTAAADNGVRGTSSHASGAGKYYVEFTAGATYAGVDTGVGIVTSGQSLTTVGATPNNAFIIYAGGAFYYNGSNQGSAGGTIAAGTIVCMAIDLVNKRAWVRTPSVGNGYWNGSATANPETNSGGVDISSVFTANAAYPLFCSNSNGSSVTANFGGSAFTYTPPAGFGNWDSTEFSYNGNQPRLIQRANPALGQNSDVVLATYSAGNGSWNTLSANTSVATADGAFEIVVDCDGNQGWINVDDLQAA